MRLWYETGSNKKPISDYSGLEDFKRLTYLSLTSTSMDDKVLANFLEHLPSNGDIVGLQLADNSIQDMSVLKSLASTLKDQFKTFSRQHFEINITTKSRVGSFSNNSDLAAFVSKLKPLEYPEKKYSFDTDVKYEYKLESDGTIRNTQKEIKIINKNLDVNNGDLEGSDIKVKLNIIKSTIVTNYQDTDGNRLAESTIDSGYDGGEYKTSAKEIYGYTLVESPQNSSGKYTDKDQTVTYKYVKNDETESTESETESTESETESTKSETESTESETDYLNFMKFCSCKMMPKLVIFKGLK